MSNVCYISIYSRYYNSLKFSLSDKLSPTLRVSIWIFSWVIEGLSRVISYIIVLAPRRWGWGFCLNWMSNEGSVVYKDYLIISSNRRLIIGLRLKIWFGSINWMIIFRLNGKGVIIILCLKIWMTLSSLLWCKYTVL